MKKYPYLIQRVLHWDTPVEDRSGVDRHFRMDYMGSAEFEFGQVPHSLRAMRAAGDSLVGPKRIKVQFGDEYYIVWYIGREEEIGTATQFLKDQLHPDAQDRAWDLKECTDIALELGTETHSRWSGKKLEPRGIAGWWALDTTWHDEKSESYHYRRDYRNPDMKFYPWAFFKKKSHAELFLSCVKDKS